MKLLALAALTLAAAAAAPPAGPPAGAPKLGFPVACEPGRTCEVQHYVDRDAGPGVRDYACGPQTYQGHTATDIRVPDLAAVRRGMAVTAAAAGTVRYVRDGVADRAVGQPTDARDPQGCGNGVSIDHPGGWLTAYCHMANGSVTVKPGQAVAAGQALGKVGMTGAADFPHLHFEVRQGNRVIDPFAPDMVAACGRQAGLWTPAAAAKMPYRAGAVLNAGFTSAQPTMADVEKGGLPPATAASPVIVVYVRAIGLLPGDVIDLDLKGPDGVSLAHGKRPPLANWRAQEMYWVGDRRPATGWPKGLYVADYKVLRGGKAAISRRLELRL